ncbi:hypothetical protein G9A89_001626 [Geosiphon pyriformis]|nr:hypothetical protein G9A89_001626 [Geosiphon pyriformis]
MASRKVHEKKQKVFSMRPKDNSPKSKQTAVLKRNYVLYLAEFTQIFISPFEMSDMTNRRSRKNYMKDCLENVLCAHYRFRQLLIAKAEALKVIVVIQNETYISKTSCCDKIKTSGGDELDPLQRIMQKIVLQSIQNFTKSTINNVPNNLQDDGEQFYVSELLEIFNVGNEFCEDDKDILRKTTEFLKEHSYHPILLFQYVYEHRDSTEYYCLLGFLYKWGLGTGIDIEQSFFWYKQAAENGDRLGQNEVGSCYSQGIGVSQDKTAAVDWYRKSAEGGHPQGQFNLAICLAHGNGVGENWEQAAYWYSEAAEAGFVDALDQLGYCYSFGKGVKQDKRRGFDYYRRAAEQGHVDGQYSVAVCFEEGQSVVRDVHEAIKWYRKSAENKYMYASYRLSWLFEHD